MSDVPISMKAEEVRAALARVQPGPIKVVLASKKVVAGIPESGLWPRVTLRLGDKEEAVALTEYADAKKKADDGRLSKLEIAILRIAGVPSRSMNSMKDKYGVAWELRAAAARVRKRIGSALSHAQTSKKLAPRLTRVQRKKRTSKATELLKDTFRRLLNGTVKIEDMTGRQIGAIWDRVKLEKVVEEVHDR